MQDKPCRHFVTRVHTLLVPDRNSHIQAPMRVLIHQCAIAEVMCSRLCNLPDGVSLADSLKRIDADGSWHCLYGPDIEPLSVPTCSARRCSQSCQSAFVSLMTNLGLDAMLPDTQ